MYGIFIIGFLSVFAYALAKNVKTMSKYREQIVHRSQLAAQQTISIEQRTREMEVLDLVEQWRDFDIRSIYPQLPESRTQGHRFLGPMPLQTEYGTAHLFDWYFVSALRKGYRMTWFQTIISFELEDRLIPSFNLRPRDLPLGVAIPGFERIPIVGLDADYRIDGAESHTIRQLFDDSKTIAELSAFLTTDKWHIDRYDHTLSVSAFSRLCVPDDIPARVKEAESIIALLQNAAKKAEADFHERLTILASNASE